MDDQMGCIQIMKSSRHVAKFLLFCGGKWKFGRLQFDSGKKLGYPDLGSKINFTEEMVMKFVGMLVAASLALGVSAPAYAASGIANITTAEGKVLLNAGKGFVPVSGPVALKVGDKVLLGKGGFATVAFKDCAVALDKPTVFTVTKNAPCSKDQLAGLEAGVFVTPVADVDYVAPTPFPYWLLAIGGGAVIITTIVVLTDGNGSSP